MTRERDELDKILDEKFTAALRHIRLYGGEIIWVPKSDYDSLKNKQEDAEARERQLVELVLELLSASNWNEYDDEANKIADKARAKLLELGIREDGENANKGE